MNKKTLIFILDFIVGILILSYINSKFGGEAMLLSLGYAMITYVFTILEIIL